MEYVGGITLLRELVLEPGNNNLAIDNPHCKMFHKVWSKYKRKLISDFSPLSSMLVCPQFQQAKLLSSFKS